MTVKFDDKGLANRIRSAAMVGVVSACEAVRTEAISLILYTNKTGKVYARGNKLHRASAPGEPPASDIGTLVNRIETNYDTTAMIGLVQARTEYAAYLEFGTKNMEPRPFMRPALARTRDGFETYVAAEVRREFHLDLKST